MSDNVLAIGLDPDLVAVLTEFAHVDSVPEAEDLLTKTEVGIIILNERNCQALNEDILQLLASTPLTTRLILITEHREYDDRYRELGIEIIDPPSHGTLIALAAGYG